MEITSPNYPMSYPSSLLCSWTVEPLSGQIIEIQFEGFEVEVKYNSIIQIV